MPIDLPDLDTLQYASVRDTLIGQIPIVAPEWTDFNDSDPGIAIIQLFAYLADQLGFRMNQIPERNYLEFLNLLGVKLRPAEAATTQLEFILSKPENALAFDIPAGSRVKAASGGPAGPPTFETDKTISAVPAQLCALVTTSSDDLRVIEPTASPGATDDVKSFIASRFALVWNGKTPKLKDLPAQPLPLFPKATQPQQQHLWIGLVFNSARNAGFLGQRVNLTVQLDDDEQPTPLAEADCDHPVQELSDAANPAAPSVMYQYYRPQELPLAPTITTLGATGSSVWRYRVVYELATGGLSAASEEGFIATAPSTLTSVNANRITFAVPNDPVDRVRIYRVGTPTGGSPSTVGKIGEIDLGATPATDHFDDTGLPGDGTLPVLGGWKDLVPVGDSTDSWTRSGVVRFDVPLDIGPIPDDEWQPVRSPVARTTAQICAEANAAADQTPLPSPVPHPLVGALKVPIDGLDLLVPVSGWIHVSFPTGLHGFSLRALSFNVAPATNARTVQNERLGTGTGLPNQTMKLANGDVLHGTLQLITDSGPDGLVHQWTEAESFDVQGPADHVFTIDEESGQVTFGDGVRGYPPENGARILATQYRWGGGTTTALGPGTITKIDTVPSPVQDATNLVAARGGKDAETLPDAKIRARQELKRLDRAVTAEDFEQLARQTPGVDIARAHVVPLRRPFKDPGLSGPGLDFDRTAAGALSIVVVPDAPGGYPMPTDSMLRTVCAYLDRFRLVTTEVHVVAPQYVRIFNVTVTLTPKPGYTATQLRTAVATQLQTYFHVLTGGGDGAGWPFGRAVHHAELIAQVFAVEGVDTVSSLDGYFDGHAPPAPDDSPVPSWRLERATPMHLTACIVDPAKDANVILLRDDEDVFVDGNSLVVSVAG